MARARDINSLWASLIVEELVRSGVDTFSVAPGSRSAPLTVALARHRRATSVVHYDERGAAFYALGYGRAVGKPAAVITTSGSALANVWPAVAEASLARVPLIVLSGDRPPELQDAGANQTMDQVGFFGDYVRWHATVPCPQAQIAPNVVLTTVDQAVYRAAGSPQGPVHLNCMYREPLAPVDDGEDFSAYLSALGEWPDTGRPYTGYGRGSGAVAGPDLEEVAALANRHAAGLLVAGRLGPGDGAELVVAMAERLQWPLLPDITSGVRLGHGGPAVVPYYDLLLASPAFVRRQPPAMVVQVGGPVTSKRLLDYLGQQRPRHYVVVSDYPGRQDPLHAATLRLDTPVQALGERLLPLLAPRRESSWLSAWRGASEAAGRRIERSFAACSALSEPLVARLVARALGSADALFLASSMPVRDADTFAASPSGPHCVDANRGASGIDGTIATAAGYAHGSGRRVVLLIGDLAFLHDLGSLALLRHAAQPMVIVVLNNNGGGIFSFLPIAAHEDVFESHFAAPHGLTFEAAAALFGLRYARPASPEEFAAAYAAARGSSNSTVIEVRTDRLENVAVHRSLIQSAVEEVESH